LDHSHKIKSALFGVALGDALGVPVEYKSREYLKANPVTDMIGYGTYNLPPGTFSDDSSLTFCLAEALSEGFDLAKIAERFIAWKYNNYWTPLGEVFDIGNLTSEAIHRLKQGGRPDLAGGFEEGDNGNGSLMRILPLVFYIQDKPVRERFRITREVSSLTHGHVRSVMACFYYLEFARMILEGKDKFEIYFTLQDQMISFFTSFSIYPNEISKFERLLKESIGEIPEDKVKSTGYVIDTLEAAIWCLMTTNDYPSAVLKAVNLGNDADTTGAVTGGLAGLLYGTEGIRLDWIEKLARRKDIEDLANRLAAAIHR
jgi:ADP-ribosyl-[dinitrogen reductase] hydrolase